MYNTDAGDVRRRLATLSDQERKVFKLRCQGSDYKTIADTLHLALSTVKQYMSRIYVKLGLDQLKPAERIKALFETFGPAFEEATLPQVEGEVVEESVPAAVQSMVDEDENAIILVRPKSTQFMQRSNPKETRQRSSFRTLVIGVVLGICLTAVVIFLFFRMNVMAEFFPDRAVATSQDLTQQPLDQGMASVAAATSTETSAAILATSATMATQAPPTEEPTLTALPQPQTLFADDFDQGLSGSWRVVSGNPVVVNGQLTSSEDTWIWIGDNSWKNYTVKLDAKAADCWFSWSWSAIGVRVQAEDKMTAFKWAYCETEWDIVKNGNWSLIPNSHVSEGSYGDMKIAVSVEDDKFSVDINGARVTSFFNSEYPQGGIAIKIGPDTIIDNLLVTASSQ